MTLSRQLSEHSRAAILLASLAAAVLTVPVVYFTDNSLRRRLDDASSTYAVPSFVFLFVTLLISPLYGVFSRLPGGAAALHARRATGVTSFFFAALHGVVAFWGPLGGFAGIPDWIPSNRWAVVLGLAALIILALLAITSFDAAVRRMGRRWRTLHWWVYPAWILIIVHTLIFSFHPPVILLILLLAFLQAWHADLKWKRSRAWWPRLGWRIGLVVGVAGILALDRVAPQFFSYLSVHQNRRAPHVSR